MSQINMIDKKYQELLQDILENGVEKKDRTGTGTISVFGRQIRYKFKDGKFPLLTTKKMYWKGIVTELLWFLRGDTNIKYLVDNGCNIWNGDAFKIYYKQSHEFKGVWPDTLNEFVERIKTDDEFARRWGDLGSIYGKQWRLKTDPDSRRNIVSAWNVGELDKMVLPPCHNFFQFYTRELTLEERVKLLGYKNEIVDKTIDRYGEDVHIENCDKHNIPARAISLMWNQRSVDTFLGLPFNIASYGLLLEMIAKEVNMIPDELIGNLGDVHLYKNHIEQAKEQLTREPMDLPKVLINNGDVDNNGTPFTKSILDGYDITDFELVNYKSHPKIKAPLSN
jgi:thymidylate synthase